MEKVWISDRTLKQAGRQMPLSFREKIELARLIDRLQVDTLELPAIENQRVDPLLIKSVASAVKHAEIAVPILLDGTGPDAAWKALREAPKARLQVVAPASSVQMEYLYHLKPQALSARVVEMIQACRNLTDRVEFIAEDAFRGDRGFLIALAQAAIDAGACIITFQEAAGVTLPEEMGGILEELLSRIERKDNVRFGVDCSNDLSLADACAIEAVHCGIREIKAASFPLSCASLPHVARILALKGEKFGVTSGVRLEEIRRVVAQIEGLCGANLPGAFPGFAEDAAQQDSEIRLSYHDSRESILRAVEQMGYMLTEEDQEKVYQAFLSVTEKKESISLKELDVLIATEAMQVPAAYQLIRFVVNSGNEIGAMAHMKLAYRDQVLEGISTGDGVIDAAFLALEKAVGRHFELDEFQIQAVTEGKEAMGETVVRLRSQGRLYSGRGLSTDIVGSSIMAYLSALNKIVYEEEEV